MPKLTEGAPAYAIGCCGIEAVRSEELPGRIGRHHVSVEEQGAPISIAGAEFHIVGYHKHRRSSGGQTSQQPGEFVFEEGVEPLGRLIE